MKSVAGLMILLMVMVAGCATRQSQGYSLDKSMKRLTASAETQPGPKSDAVNDVFQNDNPEFLEEAIEEHEEGHVYDPLFSLNRPLFLFNDRLYFWVLKPVAQGYRAIAPEPLRTGFRNFFHNLTTPVRLVNCLLQGKGRAAGTEIGRFLVNTSAGVLGFLDVAEENPDLKRPSDEDFGQTLGSYGIGNGFYIVLPFFGPSTLRDVFGVIADRFLYPVTYIEPFTASAGINVFDRINTVSFHIGDYESLKEAALDPYNAARDAYLQYRRIQIEK